MEQVIDRKAVMKQKEADEILDKCYKDSISVLGEKVIPFVKVEHTIEELVNRGDEDADE